MESTPKKRAFEADDASEVHATKRLKMVESAPGTSQLQKSKRDRDDDDSQHPPAKRAKTDMTSSQELQLQRKFPPCNVLSKPATRLLMAPKPILGPHHRSVQSKPRKQWLHEMPFEVRELIYEHCLEWNGRSPAIVRALRCCKLLYPQVIQQFYKANNTFYLNKRNGWSFCQMSEKALQSVRKLKIEIVEHRPKPKNPANWITTPKPRKVNRQYHKVPNVREITLEGCLGQVQPEIFSLLMDYIRNAKNVFSFDVDFRFLKLNPRQKRGIAILAHQATLKLGVRAVENETEKLRRKKRSGVESAVWYWEAVEKNGSLNVVRRIDSQGREIQDTTED